jgi:hypothetical protein
MAEVELVVSYWTIAGRYFIRTMSAGVRSCQTSIALHEFQGFQRTVRNAELEIEAGRSPGQ